MKKAKLSKTQTVQDMGALHKRAGKLLGSLYDENAKNLMELLYTGEKFAQALDNLKVSLASAKNNPERKEMICHSWMKSFVSED